MASETIADIVAEYRRDYEDMKAKRIYLPTAEYLRRLLDRIEAAAKREKADALSAGGLVEAIRHKLSNAAAMREALEKILEILNGEWDAHRETSAMWEMQEICTAALAAPPRNCDLPEVAEWQPTGMAKQAWRVFKRSHKDSHLDVYGLLRCINWLLAPAKKGGEK